MRLIETFAEVFCHRWIKETSTDASVLTEQHAVEVQRTIRIVNSTSRWSHHIDFLPKEWIFIIENEGKTISLTIPRSLAIDFVGLPSLYPKCTFQDKNSQKEIQTCRE